MLIYSFLLLKTVTLTAFYCKMTLNAWLDLLQFSLYTGRELTVNLLPDFTLQLKLHSLLYSEEN